MLGELEFLAFCEKALPDRRDCAIYVHPLWGWFKAPFGQYISETDPAVKRRAPVWLGRRGPLCNDLLGNLRWWEFCDREPDYLPSSDESSLGRPSGHVQHPVPESTVRIHRPFKGIASGTLVQIPGSRGQHAKTSMSLWGDNSW